MSTLLLRLAAPLQSWGSGSNFNRRSTEREPTKSGVIGLLAAALGRRRTEKLSDLTALRFGVRLDQPGQLLVDYHIARTMAAQERATGIAGKNAGTFQTWRHYLVDAIFLAGLEGEEGLLSDLERSLSNPAFPLFLGRRSCPPSGRLILGIRPQPLIPALCDEPWLASAWYRRKAKGNAKLTIISDAPNANDHRRRDMPISFEQTHRRYAFRGIDDRVDHVAISRGSMEMNATEHDPFQELGGQG